jgi:hypothetical protein
VQQAKAPQLHRSDYHTNRRRKRSLEPHGLTPDAQSVLALPIVLAPSLIVLISLAERRFGPEMAGRLNAIPLSIALAVLSVAADRGAAAGAEVAEAAAAHVPAQVAFALAFAAVLMRARGVAGTGGGDAAARGVAAAGGGDAPARGVAAAGGGDAPARGVAGMGARWRVVGGLVAGAVAFAALSLLIARVPAGVAIAASLPALALGRHVLASDAGEPGKRRGSYTELAMRAAVGLAVIVAVLVAVRVSGPGLGGAIAAFPALTATLAVMIGRVRGPVAVAPLLTGVGQGLAAYLAFCVALAFTAPWLGLAAAPLAAAACAAVYAMPQARAMIMCHSLATR